MKLIQTDRERESKRYFYDKMLVILLLCFVNMTDYKQETCVVV